MFRSPRRPRPRRLVAWLMFVLAHIGALYPANHLLDGGQPMRGQPYVVCPTNGLTEPYSVCYGTGH